LASVVGFSVTSHTFWFKPLQRKKINYLMLFQMIVCTTFVVRNYSRLGPSIHITGSYNAVAKRNKIHYGKIQNMWETHLQWDGSYVRKKTRVRSKSTFCFTHEAHVSSAILKAELTDVPSLSRPPASK
jgi:hypothetical protein